MPEGLIATNSPPLNAAKILAIEENDWLIPIILPWISFEAFKEIWASAFVHTKAAKKAAKLKWAEKEK